MGLFSPRKGRHRAVQKQVIPSWRDDDGVTLFCSGRWHGRDNSHKVPPGSFPLGLRKNGVGGWCCPALYSSILSLQSSTGWAVFLFLSHHFTFTTFLDCVHTKHTLKQQHFSPTASPISNCRLRYFPSGSRHCAKMLRIWKPTSMLHLHLG